MHPPPSKPGQIKSEERPCVEANPSKSTVHPTKENRMNPYILPIVAIGAATTVAIALGIAAMLTETPLGLKLSSYLDLRIGPGASQLDK